jgi:SAM-dependent methyltransferase
MNPITSLLYKHYRETFLAHGPTCKGVDWGDKTWAAELRQLKMLDVIKDRNEGNMSLLDVGCGYGGLVKSIREQEIKINYSGIDVVPEMIAFARNAHPDCNFTCGDFLDSRLQCHDYVVCNGVLTQKTTASTLEMNKFAQAIIRRMFDVCRRGIAFNMMTTYVNFQKDKLYYRNPSEIIAWCMSELSPHVRLDCAYDLWYEFTVYIYKPME